MTTLARIQTCLMAAAVTLLILTTANLLLTGVTVTKVEETPATTSR